jgi:apolipoprotein N-acyltransferase
MRITVRDRRYTRTALTAAGVAVVLLYIVFLRQIQTPVREGTTAVATLIQENLGVGAAAGAMGPPLTKDQMLETFSELSLFPPIGNVCYGLTELRSTYCSGPALQGNSANMHFIQPTNLIVWPEGPADFFESDPAFRLTMFRLARNADAPIISANIGMDEGFGPTRVDYNSVDFFRADGSLAGRYDKMHLVPFGEYVPYKRLFFFAGSLLQDVGMFEPGTRRLVFNTSGHSYGTFICYESIFADEVRQFENLGADVLVNVSDDGWYGDTSAAWEHLNMARMRAIENHRWVLRATNTGVTAAIDPYGRVVVSAPRHIRTSLRVGFDYQHDITFYAAHGDLFAYFCALVTTIGLGWSFLRQTA